MASLCRTTSTLSRIRSVRARLTRNPCHLVSKPVLIMQRIGRPQASRLVRDMKASRRRVVWQVAKTAVQAIVKVMKWTTNLRQEQCLASNIHFSLCRRKIAWKKVCETAHLAIPRERINLLLDRPMEIRVSWVLRACYLWQLTRQINEIKSLIYFIYSHSNTSSI